MTVHNAFHEDQGRGVENDLAAVIQAVLSSALKGDDPSLNSHVQR